MKITVTQKKLSKALNNVSRIAIGKVTLPILNNVLIRVESKKVSLITTNLDMAVIDYLPVSSSEDGTITVPAKLLAEFISNLPSGENVTFTTDDTKVTITAGQYSSTINGSPADDFPDLPEITEKSAVTYKMDIDQFKTSISSVIIASSHDLSRPALTGVYFNTQDGALAIAATDGYRLAEQKLINSVESEVAAIVPATSLQEVLRSITDDMEGIEITFSDELVRFRLGEVEIISKLIDASFPDYRKLIPKDNDIIATVSREELIRVTKLAALFARSTGGAIICEATAPDTFSVRSILNEYGENNSKITTKVEGSGKVNLNSRFLLDCLNVLSEKNLTISFSTRLTPILFHNQKDPSYTHIIMPLNS